MNSFSRTARPTRISTPTPTSAARASVSSSSSSSSSSTCSAPASTVTAAPMSLVAGVDSSTQSCKVVVLDAGTGALVREGRAGHPDGTEIHPDHWWRALSEAFDDAGGLAGVSALSVGGQQHGMVLLDREGNVLR